jgi:N-acetylmuramoyl-L-alanine amidase
MLVHEAMRSTSLLVFFILAGQAGSPWITQEAVAASKTAFDADFDGTSQLNLPTNEQPDQIAEEQKLSPLAQAPQWSHLSKYQRSIDRDSFVELLESVYAPNGAWKKTIKVDDKRASIKTSSGLPPMQLEFRDEFSPDERRRSLEMIQRAKPRGLEGIRIVLDPGHIGGKYAKIEERWFQIGDGTPVMEGDMTLIVATLLKEELQKHGARVELTRHCSSPVTHLRPETLKEEAKKSLVSQKRSVTERAINKESEKLFYRTAEIHARAVRVNETFRPDFVLALHFNAEPWGNPDKPTLVATNHLHVLVTGAFTEDELDFEDQRFRMLTKLLSQNLEKESSLAISLAQSLAEETGLPAYKYPPTAAAVPISGSDYVWARNLLANRLYDCPVIYLEPYVMNSRDVYERVQAGDYEGERSVHGVFRPSIYREYVDGVVKGLVRHYTGEPSVLPSAGGQVF